VENYKFGAVLEDRMVEVVEAETLTAQVMQAALAHQEQYESYGEQVEVLQILIQQQQPLA
jgi:hypothetical protein